MLGINLYPNALLLLPSYALMQTYAIFKYQLFNLRIVLEKSIIYSVLIAIISIAYLAIVLTAEKVLQSILGYQSASISLFAAFAIGIMVIPLRNRIQALLDRSLFKGTQPEIAAENALLRQEIAQSEKYKTLSTLATGIAHEVKNPLTAIKTFCEYLPQKLDDKEFLLKFSRLVGREVDRIDGMVHELLDYGKPAPLSLKETDIQRLITDTLDILSNKFLAHHITVTCTLDPKPCTLKIDPTRIKQALLNLFLNAIDAMPGGGKLTVTTRIKGIKDYRNSDNPSNPLPLYSSNPVFEISIQDTGCGIAAKDLPHIFDPFFTKTDHGTGLGLTITRGIIEQHGGKVSIRSQVGVGTEVRLEFPYSD
ncbi:MAG: hypothetical protein A3D87_07770 [Omnitrophica WOR_2 bacterium RIFCSPHIGHO2_02_FULL_50_17]|nr:MAG: hypothetical protein A3D87_07770 [Omnitrophica WOR_2 bacterium RIFCSPHIGHO2_02_FULL_50_17]